MNMHLNLAALALLCMTTVANAGDVARLQNGFSIRHESREVIGTSTRLYLDSSAKSFVDVPTASILNIEHEPEAVPAPVTASPALDVHDLATAAGGSNGIDPDLIDSVIKAESGFNPNAVSRKGARGLMQLMPATAQQLGVKDPFDPKANVSAGSEYLRTLLLQYDRDLAKALAAYNAGSAPVDRYHGVPPYRETYTYVSRVIADFNRKKLAERAALKSSRPAHFVEKAGHQEVSTAKGSAAPSKTE